MTWGGLAATTTISPGHMAKRVSHLQNLCVAEKLSDVGVVVSSTLLSLTPEELFNGVLAQAPTQEYFDSRHAKYVL